MSARRLRFTAPRTVAVETFPTPTPGPAEVRVETTVSAISSGTERLVYRGEAPDTLAVDSALASLDGDLSFPLSYGYAAVGTVDAVGEAVDDDWLGRRVFAFEPHASTFTTRPDALLPVPAGVSDAQAALIPTVETAVNFLLDGTPRVGERVGVFGQGMIGLTTTALLAHSPLTELLTVDACGFRRSLSERLGADESHPPGQEAISRLREGEPAGLDLAYELSGAPAALNDAVDSVGYDGRVIVGSWYGTKPVELDLADGFHRDRIDIESSQVSTIDPARRGRWSVDRRRAVACEWVQRLDLEPLLTHRFDLSAADEAYELLESSPDEAVGVVFTY